MTRRPAKIIKCCGQDLECSQFTNTCPVCQADYNGSGQLLAPRAQWGEETGETADEILGFDGMSVDELLDGEDR